MIHNYFLNLEVIGFGIRYNIVKQCNLIITKLFDHKNGELKNDSVKIRNLIVSDLIEKDEKLDDEDCYFKSS